MIDHYPPQSNRKRSKKKEAENVTVNPHLHFRFARISNPQAFEYSSSSSLESAQKSCSCSFLPRAFSWSSLVRAIVHPLHSATCDGLGVGGKGATRCTPTPHHRPHITQAFWMRTSAEATRQWIHCPSPRFREPHHCAPERLILRRRAG
jgi:hypothetical protein